MLPKNKILLFKVFISPTIDTSLLQVLHSGYIGQGTKVDEFEKKLVKRLHNPFVATVNSGTSALQLALRLANVAHGDEVISTPMTCTATNWPILAAGAKIVWADINPKDGNIDPKSIKQRITKKTKAIMCVDWGGYPCDIDAIKKYSGTIPVIEDAAHAFGAIYKNRRVGQTADYTCFSFQAIKHLTTIDGGAITMKDRTAYERGILLRWYGIDRARRSQEDRIEIDVHDWGYKFHMNDVNAAIGLENLAFTDGILKKHRSNAAYYKQTLRGLPHVRLLKENPNFISSYWLFTLLVDNRPAFSQYMRSKSIMVSQVHRRNDTHPVVQQFKTSLPGVDAFTREMVCIPVGWWLTKPQLLYVAETIAQYHPTRV